MSQIRAIQPNEVLAIDPRYTQHTRDAFFWLFGPPVRENEAYGDVHVVHVRGPLEHHDDGMSDSYEAIVARVKCAIDDGAETVVLRFDSPGGVVAGLNECVDGLRALPVRLVGYVDETCFSAAYAIACGCREVYLPASGILGSVGVISTMVDVTAADKMQGIRYVTITSGDRKADGHPHVPISEKSIDVERKRVEKLATQFFRQVARARGLSQKTIRSYEAGLFLGEEAIQAKLADGVIGWEGLLVKLQAQKPLGTRDTSVPSSVAQEGSTMSSAFEKELQARIADPKTPRAEVERLSSALAAYTKKSKKSEEKKTEEDDEEEEEAKGNETDRTDDPDKDEDDDKDEKDAKKSKKSAASKRKERMTEKKEEDDEAEALVALVQRATGQTGVAAQGALAGLVAKAAQADELAERITALETQRFTEQREAIVKSALDAKRLTPAEAKDLRQRPMAYVEAFLAARPKSVVFTSRDDLPIPAPTPSSLQGQLPDDLQKQIKLAVASIPGLDQDKVIADFHQRMNGAKNGAV